MPDTDTLRLASIVEESIVDGPGLRFTVFVQGCPHGCKGCHNPGTHAFDGGYTASVSQILELYTQNPLLQGITLSGGEPFTQAGVLCSLAEGVKALGGDVVTYTGYVYEDLVGMSPEVNKLLELTDLLIDGPYMEELRDLELLFRGSSNQRLLDKAARNQLTQ